MALFRDNRRSGYIYRSFSSDDGRTWSQPVRTDFPDARAKFHGAHMSDGRYALVSNSHPRRRDPLTLALSDDGMVFDRLFYLAGGERNGVDNVHLASRARGRSAARIGSGRPRARSTPSAAR